MNKRKRSNYVAAIVLVLFVALVLAVFIPVYQDRLVRDQVMESYAAVRVLQVKTEEYLRSNGRLPSQGKDIGLQAFARPARLSEVAFELDGALRLRFAAPERVNGRSMHLKPVVEAGKITGWRCTSDMDRKFLPGWCRD